MNTGGQAFPHHIVSDYGPTYADSGMTLRDYFAAQALTGMQIWDAVLNGKSAQFAGEKGGIDLLAKTAYDVADALIKQREGKK